MPTWFQGEALKPEQVKIGVEHRKQERVEELKDYLKGKDAGRITIMGEIAGTTVRNYLAEASQELWGKKSIRSRWEDKDTERVLVWKRINGKK